MRNHSNENEFDLHENGRAGETHFHMNGFARRLVMTQRHQVTRKWLIKCNVKFGVYLGVRTCDIFLCFGAFVFLLYLCFASTLLYFSFFVLRHRRVLTPRMSQNATFKTI